MKGHPESNNISSVGVGRLKMKKTLMMIVVVLVFSAAILATVALRMHKAKWEFNQMRIMQITLQKQRYIEKEIERKNQEMQPLRSEKMELNSKIFKVQSAISSLRDEERTLYMALYKKLKEIKQKELEIKNLLGYRLVNNLKLSDDLSPNRKLL